MFLPHIPYNKSGYLGFSVAELASHANAIDADGGQVGVAISEYSGDNIGIWQVHVNDTWQNLSLSNDKQASTKDMFLASGNVRIRLLLRDPDMLWTPHKARPYLRLHFWDGSDDLTDGYHVLNASHIKDSHAYSRNLYAEQQRLSCNEKPGNVKKYDKCGKCGGKDLCCGCDKERCLGAQSKDLRAVRRCNKCAQANETVTDCRGKCNKYVKDKCGKCMRIGAKRKSTDCADVCFGKAQLDRCGVCYGGNTNETKHSTVDICNVCGGDNTSCGGCSVKEGKKFDLCGKCLHPRDTKFNDCFKLKSIQPNFADISGGDEIIVTGSGFKISMMSCSFKKSGGISHAIAIGGGTKTSMKLTTLKLSEGNYEFACSLENQTETVSGFLVYTVNSTKATSITPSEIPIKKAVNVTVNGEGFKDTGEVQCTILVKNVVIHVVNGEYVSETAVRCLLPPTANSEKALLALSISKNRWAFPLTIYAPAPVFLQAKMKDNYREIVLTFDSPVWTTEKTCNNLFSAATLEKFGTRPRCSIKGKKELHIRLRSSATIQFNDTITLAKDNFKTRSQVEAKSTPETNRTLDKPNKELVRVADISGPNILGSCELLKLSGRKSRGGGGRPLKYHWFVDFASSVDINSLNETVKTGLADLKAKLQNMTKKSAVSLIGDYLEPGVSYNFTLYIQNYWKQNSDKISHEVKRKSTPLPVVRILGGRRQSIRASRLSKIQSVARIPTCYSEKDELDFTWLCTSDDRVTLDDKSSTKSKLYIQPGTLEGDTLYVLTLIVSLKDDPTISVSVDVEVDVKSSALVGRIKGGRRRVIGFGQSLRLDGSLSYDPDGSDDTEYHDWECLDEEEFSCYYTNEQDEYTELLLNSTPKVVVSGGLLESGKSYKFILYYSKGMRSSKPVETKVEILDSIPPSVHIKNQKKIKENVDSFIVVRGRVKSLLGNMRIWIECVDEEGFSFINLREDNVLLTDVEVSGVGKGYRPIGMVFNKNVLDSGANYKFVIYATDAGGTGYSEIILTTNAPPSVGVLETDFEKGTALNTTFTLSAVEGWDDDIDDLPLVYHFGYYTSKGKKRYLGSPSTESSNSYVLPAGDPDDKELKNKLNIFVEVSDIHGSKVQNEYPLVVEPPAKLDATAITNVMSTIDGALTADDLSSALGLISSSLTTFDATAPVYVENGMDATAIENYEEITEKLLEMKENITNSVLTMATDIDANDEETQDVVIDALGDMTKGGADFTPETKTKISTTITTIVKSQISRAPSTTTSTTNRKRRSTDGGESSAIEAEGKAFDVEGVEKVLTPLGNIIVVDDVGETSMTTKKNFTGDNRLNDIHVQRYCFWTVAYYCYK